MKQTQNQYFGLERNVPRILNPGSLYVAVDTKSVFMADRSGFLVKIAGSDSIYSNFDSLTDTEDSKAGKGGKYLRVSDDELSIEYVDVVVPEDGIGISQQVEKYSDLVPGTEVGLLAYAEQSEGTKWLPGTIGGTYYPQGFYLWDGVSWVSDRNAIASQFQTLIVQMESKVDDVDIDGKIYARSDKGWVEITEGNDGADGKSAYEIAVDNGFVGTEQEWLDSLQGEDGEKGDDGAPGQDGANGADGSNGQDGLSAYQVWLNQGNSGTEQDFIDSLQGEQGIQGIQGPPGNDGADGANGVDGDGFTGGSYNASNGIVTFTSDDGLGFSTSDLRGTNGTDGLDGSDGDGFTGGSYDSGTGIVTFTSDDGIGFSTGDLRGTNGTNGTNGFDGADGEGFTGGSYDPSSGVVTFTSDDGLGFSTGDLRGADGPPGNDGNDGSNGQDGAPGVSTYTKSFAAKSPIIETITLFCSLGEVTNITDVIVSVKGSGSLDLALYYDSDSASNTNEIIPTTTFSTSTGTIITSFTNSSVPLNNFVNLDITSVNSIDELNITIKYGI